MFDSQISLLLLFALRDTLTPLPHPWKKYIRETPKDKKDLSGKFWYTNSRPKAMSTLDSFNTFSSNQKLQQALIILVKLHIGFVYQGARYT